MKDLSEAELVEMEQRAHALVEIMADVNLLLDEKIPERHANKISFHTDQMDVETVRDDVLSLVAMMRQMRGVPR